MRNSFSALGVQNHRSDATDDRMFIQKSDQFLTTTSAQYSIRIEKQAIIGLQVRQCEVVGSPESVVERALDQRHPGILPFYQLCSAVGRDIINRNNSCQTGIDNLGQGIETFTDVLDCIACYDNYRYP